MTADADMRTALVDADAVMGGAIGRLLDHAGLTYEHAARAIAMSADALDRQRIVAHERRPVYCSRRDLERATLQAAYLAGFGLAATLATPPPQPHKEEEPSP